MAILATNGRYQLSWWCWSLWRTSHQYWTSAPVNIYSNPVTSSVIAGNLYKDHNDVTKLFPSKNINVIFIIIELKVPKWTWTYYLPFGEFLLISNFQIEIFEINLKQYLNFRTYILDTCQYAFLIYNTTSWNKTILLAVFKVS